MLDKALSLWRNTMPKSTVLAVFLAFLGTLSLSVPALADLALPPGLLVPYDKSDLEVSCGRHEDTLTIYLSTPGPCDYSVGLFDQNGKALVGPNEGSHEHFGRRNLYLTAKLPTLSPGETRTLRYTAKGRLYRYKKVPTRDEESSKLEKLGKNLLIRSGLADPMDFRYELQDKKGKSFTFDVPIVVHEDKGSLSVQCNGKAVE